MFELCRDPIYMDVYGTPIPIVYPASLYRTLITPDHQTLVFPVPIPIRVAPSKPSSCISLYKKWPTFYTPIGYTSSSKGAFDRTQVAFEAIGCEDLYICILRV